MTITSATLRRLATLDVTLEALRDFMRMLADQEEAEEQRKAKDRARKKTGKSMEGDRNFHGSGQESAAETPKKPVDIITTTTKIDNTPSQQQHRSPRTSRGTRLPDDFQPHPNILELARGRGFTDADYWDHFERFKDYWRGVSGAKGIKLDWNATWRNRVKDLADRKGSFNGKPPQNSIAAGFAKINAALDERIRSEGGDTDRPEDPGSVPGLRQGPGRLPTLGH